MKRTYLAILLAIVSSPALGQVTPGPIQETTSHTWGKTPTPFAIF